MKNDLLNNYLKV